MKPRILVFVLITIVGLAILAGISWLVLADRGSGSPGNPPTSSSGTNDDLANGESDLPTTPEVPADDLMPPPALDGHMAGGVFALGPSDGRASQDFVWADPDISGVFVRTPWNAFQKKAGTTAAAYDFSVIDHELNQAITNGKYVTLSLSAGKEGTPKWLFTDGGVQGYDFQDGASGLMGGKCGARMTLGDPTDKAYQDWYFGAIRMLGEHIKTNPTWYDAVAYVKISGANLYTHENRLPKRCEPGCVCNPQVWSEAGYTPSGLYDFYLKEMAVIQEVFPGKPMMYALIQDGFPELNDDGDYEQQDGTSSGGELVRSVKQVEEILRLGTKSYDQLFVTQHNGLQPEHEPNRWVTENGDRGFPTAFQTTNLQVTSTPAQLQQTFENMWQNSKAHYLEIYSELLRIVRDEDGVLVPDSAAETNTLEEWDTLLKTRAP